MRDFYIIHIISFKRSPLIHNQQRRSMFIQTQDTTQQTPNINAI